MKGFLSFIIAIIIYLILGLIAWNIVCSFIDIPSKTLEQLADYRIFTYSGIAALPILWGIVFEDANDDAILFYAIILGINMGIAIAINHWENVWPSVSVIFTIIYNLVNILWITLFVRSFFD